jgi:hypothetical protein
LGTIAAGRRLDDHDGDDSNNKKKINSSVDNINTMEAEEQR